MRIWSLLVAGVEERDGPDFSARGPTVLRQGTHFKAPTRQGELISAGGFFCRSGTILRHGRRGLQLMLVWSLRALVVTWWSTLTVAPVVPPPVSGALASWHRRRGRYGGGHSAYQEQRWAGVGGNPVALQGRSVRGHGC